MSSQQIEAPKLPYPFALGSVVSIVLGTVTLYIEMNNLTTWQWSWAPTIGAALVFGYFPVITLLVSPVLMAVVAYAEYRNTRGLWWYFGGSAIFGFIYAVFIWGFLFVGFILSGSP